MAKSYEDLIIRIKQELETSALKKLKSDMGEVSKAMDDLVKQGKRNTAEYTNLVKVSGELSNKYKVLKSEQRGVLEGTQTQSKLGTHFNELNKNLKDYTSNLAKSKSEGFSIASSWAIIGGAIAVGINYLKQYAKEFYNIVKAGLEFANIYEHFVKVNGGIEQANKTLMQFRTAVAGGMNDSELIKYSNTMQSLGFNTKITTQILDFAERKSDELGTTIEGASDVLLRFLETGKGKGLYQYGVEVDKVNLRMSEMTGLTKKQIEQLSSEDQQRIRTAATMELYGNTLEQINKKELDNADKLQRVEMELKNTELWFGRAFGGEVFNSISRINQGLRELNIITDKNKISSKDFGTALGEAFGKVLPFILGGYLGILISQLDKVARGFTIVKKSVYDVGNALRTPLSDAFARELMTVLDYVSERAKRLWGLISKLLNITGTKTTGLGGKQEATGTGKDVLSEDMHGMGYLVDDTEDIKKEKKDKGSKEKEQKRDRFDALVQDWETAKQEDELLTSLTKAKLDVWKKDLELGRIDIDKLIESEADNDKAYALKQKRLQILAKIQDVDKLIKDRTLSPDKTKEMGVVKEDLTEKETIQSPKSKKEEITDWLKKNEDLPFFIKQAENARIFDEVLNQVVNTTSNLFSELVKGGEGSKDAFKNFMKSIVITYLTSVQAMVLGAAAAASAKGITSFGISLITDMPELAAAWVSLELAKGIISGLASGGPFSPGTYRVNEVGGELAVMGRSGYMINNDDLYNMINAWKTGRGNNNPAPIVEVKNHYYNLIDGMTFNSKTETKIKKKTLGNV